MTSIDLLRAASWLIVPIMIWFAAATAPQPPPVSPVPSGWVRGLLDTTSDGGETRECRAVIQADDGWQYLVMVDYEMCGRGNLGQSWSP